MDLVTWEKRVLAEKKVTASVPASVQREQQISYEDMEQLFREVPKLERYFRIILQKAYGNMTKRIVQNHSLPAKERYLLFRETYPEIVQRVPQYMIASYLGITKEFLSNIRRRIAEESKS